MATMVEIVENAFIGEPEAGAQPGSTQPDDAAIEFELTQEISTLWSNHVSLSANRKVTSKELRQIRARLAGRLFEMKSLLSRPGRLGKWRDWLKQQNIPRSTADRLASRHAETLGIENGNVPTGAIPEPAEAAAERLAKVVWPRFKKVLATGESVVHFLGCIAEISGVPHEWREEGLVIFKAVPKAEDELHASAPATDLASQLSDNGDADTAELAAEITMGTPAMEQDAADGDNCAGASA
jgi:hypothetical protein